MFIFESRVFRGLAAMAALFMCAPAQAENGTILSGVLDLARHVDTAPIDGCDTVHKAVSMNDEFMLIACEKLLPHIPISVHQATADNYAAQLAAQGWRSRARREGERGQVYTKTDAMGCPVSVDIMAWTDRSLGEMAGAAREDHRQIVFFTTFKGPQCYYRYDETVAMAGPVIRSVRFDAVPNGALASR